MLFARVETEDMLQTWKKIWSEACIEKGYEDNSLFMNVHGTRYLALDEKNGDAIGTIELTPFAYNDIDEYVDHCFAKHALVQKYQKDAYQIDRLAIRADVRGGLKHIDAFWAAIYHHVKETDAKLLFGASEVRWYKTLRFMLDRKGIKVTQIADAYTMGQQKLVPNVCDLTTLDANANLLKKLQNSQEKEYV